MYEGYVECRKLFTSTAKVDLSGANSAFHSSATGVRHKEAHVCKTVTRRGNVNRAIAIFGLVPSLFANDI